MMADLFDVRAQVITNLFAIFMTKGILTKEQLVPKWNKFDRRKTELQLALCGSTT